MSGARLWRPFRRLLGRSSRREAPGPVRSAVLEYGRRRFVKSYRSHVANDFRRGLAIHGAAGSGGAFRAPRPLVLLEDHDLIVWECLDGLLELRELLMRDVRARHEIAAFRAAIFERAGRALASIHEALAGLGEGTRYQPFDGLRTGDEALDAHVAQRMAEAPWRPQHWDFVCGNLFVLDAESEAASPTLVGDRRRLRTGTSNPPDDDTSVYSPAYLDGATLVFSLWSHPRFSPSVAHERAAYLAAFVAGYAAVSGVHLDVATILACAARGGAATTRPSSTRAGPVVRAEDPAERRLRLESIEAPADGGARGPDAGAVPDERRASGRRARRGPARPPPAAAATS